MSPEKAYGRDGPPQLQGRVEDISPEVQAEWVAAGADWMRDAPTDPQYWEKLVRCTCGRHDAFEVRFANSDHPEWPAGDYYGGNFRWDLRCLACGTDLLLFDNGIHGYNAVVCDERAGLPPGYLEANGKLLQRLYCGCGNRTFSVIAAAEYDCEEDIPELPPEIRGDAYGSFGASAKCTQCGAIDEIVNAETA